MTDLNLAALSVLKQAWEHIQKFQQEETRR